MRFGHLLQCAQYWHAVMKTRLLFSHLQLLWLLTYTYSYQYCAPTGNYATVVLDCRLDRCPGVFSFSNFLMLNQKWRSATRGFSQIWLQSRKEVENFGILYCMLENQWNLLLSKCGHFKKSKLETCPTPPTSLKYDNFLGIFSKSFLDQWLGTFFLCSNMANFCHQKITGSQQLLRLSLSSSVQLSPSISLSS